MMDRCILRTAISFVLLCSIKSPPLVQYKSLQTSVFDNLLIENCRVFNAASGYGFFPTPPTVVSQTANTDSVFIETNHPNCVWSNKSFKMAKFHQNFDENSTFSRKTAPVTRIIEKLVKFLRHGGDYSSVGSLKILKSLFLRSNFGRNLMVVSRSLRDSAIHLKVPVTIKGALVNNIGVTPHSVGQKEQILGNFQKFYQVSGVNFKGSAIQNKHLSSKKKVKQVKKLQIPVSST